MILKTAYKMKPPPSVKPHPNILERLGVVGLWAVTERSGLTVLDLSRHKNTGTLFGNAGFVPGLFGRALNIAADGDYVSCGSDSSLNFGTGDFTILAWVKAAGGANAWSGIIHKGETGAAGGYQPAYSFSQQSTNDNYFFAAGNWADRAYFGALHDGAWHCLVGVVESGESRAYLDNLYKDNSTATDPDHTNPLCIGKGILNRSVVCQIDHVMICSRALTISELTRLYLHPCWMFEQRAKPQLALIPD